MIDTLKMVSDIYMNIPIYMYRNTNFYLYILIYFHIQKFELADDRYIEEGLCIRKKMIFIYMHTYIYV
jgi:hypothetical protein